MGLPYHRGKVPLSLHRIKRMCYQYDLCLMTLTLITWLRWRRGGAVPGFSTVKLPLNFPKGYHFYFERITVATV